MASLKKAVLLSGGIDSICLTYGLKPDIAYTINYGQNVADREVLVSKLICEQLNIDHKVIEVNCSQLGTGDLVSKNSLTISPSEEWWPFRNQLLITLCLMQAISDNVKEIHLASVKSDFFHKDGTQEFYKLINSLTIYQEGNIEIKCETLDFYSHELAIKFNVPLDLLSLAHSCHLSNTACGHCSGCLKQIRVRQELNME